MTLKIAILGSTRGSNLEPLVQLLQAKQLPVEIVLLVSDRENALILERAQTLKIPTQFLSAKGLTREEYGEKLDTLLQQYQVDLIVLIGFMRILSADFTQKWPERIINVHPSLLPRHAGLMDLQVHAAAIDAGDTESGCSVHVVEAKVDAGQILVQKRCPIEIGETPESLKAKVQALEVPALVEAIQTKLLN